jgi:dolichyl-phosphate-mannose-protein mannosyltransferase
VTAVLEAPDETTSSSPTWRARLAPLVSARGGWGWTLLVGLLAGALRFARLDLPAGRIFDEVYYACDAQNLLRYGVEHDSMPGNGNCVPSGSGAFIVHPPLGKWAIALGEKLFGVNEFGWRSAAALAGTLTVVLVVRAGRRMTGSTLLGCLAGVLLSLDGLSFVQSRVAMLDIFLVLWTTAAFTCLLVDRDQVRSRLAAADGPAARLGRRPWLLLAGACLGAAVATKWSGIYYLAALVLLAAGWEVGARRTAGAGRPWRATLRRSALPLLAALVVLPALLYVLSWAGWFASDIGYDRHWAQSHPSTWHLGFLPDALRSWAHYHQEIYDFHSGLSARHPYQSHPLGWLLLVRPVSYYYPAGITEGAYGCAAASCSREVLAIGTPILWWGGIAALIALVWLWVARRDWRAPALLLLVATGIAPWIRDDLKQRTMFLFYALPAVPFLCLGIALVAGWALGPRVASRQRRAVGAAGVGLFLAAVVVNFAYLYPVLAAETIPYASWFSRMWLRSWI